MTAAVHDGDTTVVVDLVEQQGPIDVEGLAAELGPRGWDPGRVVEAAARARHAGLLYVDCRGELETCPRTADHGRRA